MKAKIYSLLAVLLTIVSLTGCDDWSPSTQFAKNTGGVTFEGFDVEVASQPTEASNASRAGEEIDVNDFIVTIYDRTTGKVANLASYDSEGNVRPASWKFSAMPEVMTLRVGSYKVVVKSHEPEAAAWEAPYYEGSKEFTIEEGRITSIGTVTAKFAAVKVEVKFSELLMKNMADDCTVTVVAGTGGTLVWSKTESRMGYFDVTSGATTLVATFEGTVRGSAQRSVQEFSDVTGGKYYIITYKMATGDTTVPDEMGDANPSGVSVSGQIEEQGESGNVNGGDNGSGTGSGRPDEEQWPDDPGTKPDPTPGPGDGDGDGDNELTADDFFKTDGIPGDSNYPKSALELGLDKENPSDANPAVVYIYSKTGIAHLKVKISSDNENFMSSAGSMLPLEFDLATCVDGNGNEIEDKEAIFGESLGLPYDVEVKGQGVTRPVTFDVTGLLPLLDAEAFWGKHTFTISVSDQEDAEKYYTTYLVIRTGDEN